MADAPQSLAARVRAKYPGAYDDLSDDDLEAKVVAKYPQYADLVKPKAESKSLMGLATNAVNDTADLGRGLVTMVRHPVDTASNVVKGLFDTGQGLAAKAFGDVTPESRNVDAMIQSAKDSYGSPSAILNTAYKRPVSAAMNVAGLLEGGAGALRGVGLAGDVADAMAMTGKVVNPATVPLWGAGKALEVLGDVPTALSVRPSAKLVEKSRAGGRMAMARAMNEAGITSEADATQKMLASKSGADAIASAAAAANPTPIPMSELTPGMLDTVGGAMQDRALGEPSAMADLGRISDRVNEYIAEHPNGIDIEKARDLKRRLDTKTGPAHERASMGMPEGPIDAELRKAQGSDSRTAVGNRAPGLFEADATTSQLNTFAKAMKAAELRPGILSKLFAVSGLTAGHPAALLSMLTDLPNVGAGTGVAMNMGGNALMSEAAQRAALLAALTGEANKP